MLAKRSEESLTLWELEAELLEAYQRVDEAETEEEKTLAMTILETYLTASVEKRDRVGGFMMHLLDTATMIESERERLEKKQKRIEAVAEHMRDYILAVMERVGVKKLEGKLFTFAAKSNPPAVEITDELAISPDFLVQPPPPPPRIDKAAIKDALKRGEEVEGARLIQRKRLEII